jgi:hypothetical protein
VTRRLVLPILLSLGAAGCFAWRPWEPAAPLAGGAHLPHRVRVTTEDSTRVALNGPYVRGDSLFGRTDDGRKGMGFALTDVRSFEAERFHLWRTLGATVALPAAALIVTYLIVCDGGESCQAQTVE